MPGPTARTIFSDAMAVGTGYLVSFAYPVVSLPFLTRVLGSHAFGKLVFVLAVIQIVIYVTDYGFTVSAMRRIAVATAPATRNDIMSGTLGAKLALWVATSVTVLLIIRFVGSMHVGISVYLLGLTLILGKVAFPDWLLQGLGYAKLFAVVLSASRVFALAGLLLTVTDQSDLWLALVWQLAPWGIAAVMAWVTLAFRLHLDIPRINLALVWDALKDGRHLFLSNMADMGASAANTVALGGVSSPFQVGLFGAAERLGNAGRGVAGGIQDALIPRMVAAGFDDRGRSARRLISGLLIFVNTLGGLLLCVSAQWLIPFYLGSGYGGAVPVARLIGLSLCVAGGSAVFIIRAQAAHRFRAVAIISLVSAALHLGALTFLGYVYGARGAALALVITETIQLGIFAIDAHRSRRYSRRYSDETTMEGTESCRYPA